MRTCAGARRPGWPVPSGGQPQAGGLGGAEEAAQAHRRPQGQAQGECGLPAPACLLVHSVSRCMLGKSQLQRLHTVVHLQCLQLGGCSRHLQARLPPPGGIWMLKGFSRLKGHDTHGFCSSRGWHEMMRCLLRRETLCEAAATRGAGHTVPGLSRSVPGHGIRHVMGVCCCCRRGLPRLSSCSGSGSSVPSRPPRLRESWPARRP